MAMVFIPHDEDQEFDPGLIDAAIQWGVQAGIVDETGGPNSEPVLLVPADEIDESLATVLPEPPDEDDDDDNEGPSEYDRLREEFGGSPYPAALITYLLRTECLPCNTDDLPQGEGDDGEEG